MKAKFYYLMMMLLFTTNFIFISCKNTNEGEYMSDSVGFKEETMSAESAAQNSKLVTNLSNPTSTEIPIQRKLIKEADLSWETNNLEKAHNLIISKVKKYNAYIFGDNQYKNEDEMANDITVKISADKFDDFLKDIYRDIKYFDKKDIRVVDVTEEYVDVEARIKTKKELEQRYLEILQKANSVQDILDVESQLNNVRTEIESAEARMKVLSHQITLSTININFYETISAPIGFVGQIGKSFIVGWHSILHFILGIINIWPFVLIIGGIIYFLYKKRKQRKQ